MAVRHFSDKNPDGNSFGQSTSDLVSLYGVTPISQRASSIQAASLVSANSWVSVTSNQAAFNLEVTQALTALGIWKGAA